uniref:G_PROTEIN_RECEP_F1_2 domain-containing protein n=1 Tax=Rhabditophanes sp. KR3021 TaxID=114890 RepID=A0AC35U988_9BILA
MKNYIRIRLVVLISLISTITILLPSATSLASFFGECTALADASDWMSVVKSSINLFVYCLLNKEFQEHFFGNLLRIRKFKPESSTTSKEMSSPRLVT